MTEKDAEYINERKNVEDALNTLAGMDPLVDIEEFYRICVSNLARVYGTQFAFVGLIVNPEHTRVQTQALWDGRQHIENFEYELAGTPCADILNRTIELIPSDAAKKYPEDLMLVDMGVESYFGAPLITTTGETIGLVSVLDVTPMDITSWSKPILGIFAQRLAYAVERLRVNQALEKSEAYYRNLVETAQAVPWEFNLSTMRFTYVGPQAEALLGHPAEKWYEENFWPDYMHPDDRDQAINYCMNAVKEESEHEFEYRMFAQDGQVVWIRDTVNVMSDIDNSHLLHGFMFDITQRKKTEDALERSEERFRTLIETTSDWIWEVDENAVYTYTSPKVRELLGYDPQEIIGKTPFDLMPEEEAKRVNNLFDNIVREHQAFDRLENINCRRDGELIVLETSGVPVFDTDGEFKGYRGVNRDITDRKRAEDALKKTQSEWANAMEFMEDAIYIVDMDDKVILANRAFYDLKGLAPEHVIGHDVTSIMHPDGELIPCPVCEARIEKRDAHLIMDADQNLTGKPVDVIIRVL